MAYQTKKEIKLRNGTCQFDKQISKWQILGCILSHCCQHDSIPCNKIHPAPSNPLVITPLLWCPHAFRLLILTVTTKCPRICQSALCLICGLLQRPFPWGYCTSTRTPSSTGRPCSGFIAEARGPGGLRILSPGNASDRPPGNAALFVSWSTSPLFLVIVLSHLLKHSFNFSLTLAWKVVVIWKICSWFSDRILVLGCILFRVTDFHSSILINNDVTFERLIFKFRRQVSLT